MRLFSASALPTVLVISVLVSLLVLFSIMLFNIDALFYSIFHTGRQQKEDLNSAFVLYCNDSTFLKIFEDVNSYLLYEDRPSSAVSLQVRPWGFYECVTVSANDGKAVSVRLLGKVQESSFEAALWVCSRDMILSLAGGTEVEGKIFAPINGLSYVQLPDHHFSGTTLDDSCVDLSERELPTIDSQYFEPAKTLINQQEILTFPSGEAAKPYYSFQEKTAYFYYPEVVEPLHVRGNVVLYADSVSLMAGSILSDIILVARKVTVEEGFTGSLQILATDTVILKDNTHLRYPSGIYLKGNQGKTYLSLGSHSTLSGYAIVFGDVENQSGSSLQVDNNYHQAVTANFSGLLYVDGIADIRGEFSGSLYLKECFYLPENGLYAGTICDARISRNRRIAYPFLFSHSSYRRKEIKMVY